jgi:hypothetical protein
LNENNAVAKSASRVILTDILRESAYRLEGAVKPLERSARW